MSEPTWIVPDHTGRIDELEQQLADAKEAAKVWHDRYVEKCQQSKDALANRGQDIVGLESQLAEREKQIALLRDALTHYAKEDERNARHYPPEFAKDALTATEPK